MSCDDEVTPSSDAEDAAEAAMMDYADAVRMHRAYCNQWDDGHVSLTRAILMRAIEALDATVVHK